MPAYPVRHLSASSIADWLECPLRWHGRRVAHWPDPPSVAMAMGKAMHSGFEAHHLGRDAETALMAAWEAEAIVGQAPPKGALLRAFEALRAYQLHNPRDRRDRPEVRFSLKLTGLPVPIIGFIDVLRGDEIHECKTGSRTWWTQERADSAIQPGIYSLAYRAMFGMAAEKVVYHIVPTQPVLAPPYRLETTRTPAQLADLETLIRRVWREITTADLTASCRPDRCTFGSLCLPWRNDDPANALRPAANRQPAGCDIDLAAGLADAGG